MFQASSRAANSVNKETTVSEEKPTLVTEKANRYKHCGTIEEWEKEQAKKKIRYLHQRMKER